MLVSGLKGHKFETHWRHCIMSLTHLCRMDFPISINWVSLFPILGLLDGIIHFIQILKETSGSKQLRT